MTSYSPEVVAQRLRNAAAQHQAEARLDIELAERIPKHAAKLRQAAALHRVTAADLIATADHLERTAS